MIFLGPIARLVGLHLVAITLFGGLIPLSVAALEALGGTHPTHADFADVLPHAAVLLSAAAAGWLVLATGALLLGLLPGSAAVAARRVARTLTSARSRRLLLGVAGVGLLAAPASPVAADPSPPPPDRAVLDGLPLPDRPAAAPPPPVHVVRLGESLWEIAAGHLAPDAGPVAVDSGWRRWYAANRRVIGPDPDLILPGQHLVPPAERTSP